MIEKITLEVKDLPIYLELINEKGEKRLYKIMPAGRKFGAHLNSVDTNEKKLEVVSKSHLRPNGRVAGLRQMLTYPCMLRFPDRPGALPLSLIWNFETTSNTKSINKAKVKYFRFHALRHFGASMLDSANVPIGSIQRILSHENRSTTENYLHSIGDSERQAMDVLNAQFENFSHTNSHTNKKGLQS